MSIRAHVESALADDEEIIHEQGPDARAWALGQIPEAVVVLICLLVAAATDTALVRTIALLGAAALVVMTISGYLQRRATRYVLTQHRVILFSGVLRRDHEWMSWKKVTDVSVRRSFIDRWTATATVKIQSANEASGFAAMTDLARPLEFGQMVVDLVNAEQGRVRLARPRV